MVAKIKKIKWLKSFFVILLFVTAMSLPLHAIVSNKTSSNNANNSYPSISPDYDIEVEGVTINQTEIFF